MGRTKPRFVAPMMALLDDKMPEGPEWIYETKLDGIRAIAVKAGSTVQLFSRRPREITADFPEIVAALKKIPLKDFVVDGEIIALDAEGKSSFQLLQNVRRSPDGATPVFYVLFDVLHAGGVDVTASPLEERRKLLKGLFPRIKAPLRLSPELKGEPSMIWTEAKRLGLEGIIAKHRQSPYEPERRTGFWRKIKTQTEQEFVIGGYTEPRGARKFFGSILVGYYSGSDLLFASGVGTGFDEAWLRSLSALFKKRRVVECPFANLPLARRCRWGGGFSSAEMSRCSWVKPDLVCQIRFQEWTRDGNLRQPVFLGLRQDKKAREVVREIADNGDLTAEAA